MDSLRNNKKLDVSGENLNVNNFEVDDSIEVINEHVKIMKKKIIKKKNTNRNKKLKNPNESIVEIDDDEDDSCNEDKKDDFDYKNISHFFEYFNTTPYNVIDPNIVTNSPIFYMYPDFIWLYVNYFYFNYNKKSLNYITKKLNSIKSKNDNLMKKILTNDNKFIYTKESLKELIPIDKHTKPNDCRFLKFRYLYKTEDIKNKSIDSLISKYVLDIQTFKEKIKTKLNILEIKKENHYNLESKFIDMNKSKIKNISYINILEEEGKYLNYWEIKANKPINIENNMDICHVCNKYSPKSKAEIIFCSNCNISIHIKCYGLKNLPKNTNWICKVCINFSDSGKLLPCCLCNVRGGVLIKSSIDINTDFFIKKNKIYNNYLIKCRKFGKIKKFTNNEKITKIELIQNLNKKYKTDYNNNEILTYEPIIKKLWVHISCIQWNTQINSALNKFTINGLSYIFKKYFDKQCEGCETTNGVCVKCFNSDCNRYFHIECGRMVNCHLEIEYSIKNVYKFYCNLHKPVQLRKNLDSKKKFFKNNLKIFCKNFISICYDYNGINNELEIEDYLIHLKKSERYFLDKFKLYVFKDLTYSFRIYTKDNKVTQCYISDKNYLKNYGLCMGVFKLFIKENYSKNQNIKHIYSYYRGLIKELKNFSKNRSLKKITLMNKKYKNTKLTSCDCFHDKFKGILFECEFCNNLYHILCQNINKEELIKLKKYICNNCKKIYI